LPASDHNHNHNHDYNQGITAARLGGEAMFRLVLQL
jgi:hypothetical protein